MKILLVEDDAVVSKAVAKGLRKQGYMVDCVYDGEAALEAHAVNEYDLMILDLNLPKLSGMEVLEHIRQQDDALKILILSARDTIEDKILGLDGGCSDYLTKPFDFRELEARIRSLLRRQFTHKNTELACGSLKIETAKKQVYVQDREVTLAPKEYGILEYLMFHRNRVVSAEELIEHVWESDADLFSNSFKVHMHSLKKKLEAAGGGGQYIMNQRRQGYRIAEAMEDMK